jgi:hypothetical protein
MEKVRYFWRVAYAHTIAYFVAGFFAVTVMNYRELFEAEPIVAFMRPVDDPIVALGPSFQVLRGLLLGLILMPLRRVFFEQRRGLWILAGLILGLSLLSTIGPTIGSFEGYIYTTIPWKLQAVGYPEAILYTGVFIWILHLGRLYDRKSWMIALTVFLVVVVILSGIAGYFLGGAA